MALMTLNVGRRLFGIPSRGGSLPERQRRPAPGDRRGGFVGPLAQAVAAVTGLDNYDPEQESRTLRIAQSWRALRGQARKRPAH